MSEASEAAKLVVSKLKLIDNLYAVDDCELAKIIDKHMVPRAEADSLAEAAANWYYGRIESRQAEAEIGAALAAYRKAREGKA